MQGKEKRLAKELKGNGPSPHELWAFKNGGEVQYYQEKDRYGRKKKRGMASATNKGVASATTQSHLGKEEEDHPVGGKMTGGRGNKLSERKRGRRRQ